MSFRKNPVTSIEIRKDFLELMMLLYPILSLLPLVPLPPSAMSSSSESSPLCCVFRGKEIPITYSASVSREVAQQAIEAPNFTRWLCKCERSTDDDSSKRLELHGIELQSVDMFGKRVGFIKLKSHCTLVDFDDKKSTAASHQTAEHSLPGICFLRGDSVAILVALFCGNQAYSLLVEQPRIPIGSVSFLELPADMMDDNTLSGTAIQELHEECGIHVNESDQELVDLTELAGSTDGLALSPGGSDERCRFLYLEKTVSADQLEAMKGRLTGLREHGEVITLRVVPIEEMWTRSMDAKAMLALFLVDQLRKQGKLPPAGQLATSLSDPNDE